MFRNICVQRAHRISVLLVYSAYLVMSVAKPDQDNWRKSEEEGGWDDAIKSCIYGREYHDRFIEYEKAEGELRQLIQSTWDQRIRDGYICIPEGKKKRPDMPDEVAKKLLHYSRFIVRIQRKYSDPNRNQGSPDIKGGGASSPPGTAEGCQSSSPGIPAGDPSKEGKPSGIPGDNPSRGHKSPGPPGGGTGVFIYAGLPFCGTSCASVTVTSGHAGEYSSEFIFQSDPRALEKLKFDLEKRSFILTNNHVIWNKYEAQSAWADFFFDKPGSGDLPPEGLVRVKITGMYQIHSPRVQRGKAADSDHLDFCLLTFYATKRQWLDLGAQGISIQHGLAFVGTEFPTPSINDPLVYFGHPHGKSKRLSTGKLLEPIQNEDCFTEFEIRYELPTYVTGLQVVISSVWLSVRI